MLRSFLLASLSLLPLTILHAAPLAVENFTTGTAVDYQVVLLRGTVEDGAKSLRIANTSAGAKPALSEALVKDGRFKALVALLPGQNKLALKSDLSPAPLWLELEYKESKNPHYVRLIWMTDSSGATDFATPEDGFPQDYEGRLRTAALLMQTFTAERMNEAGYGRRTFRLERDAEGQVVVHTLKAPETAATYAALKDTDWWGRIGAWLNREHPDPFAKNCVLAAFTRKDAATGKLSNHTALGGGNLGLFGSASVFSWPRSIPEAQAAFSDRTRFEATRVHDDSVGRSVIWGLATTTIGATLHEMGHTFGLPHTKDGRDIMTRGFDRFNRAFTFEDPPSRISLRARPFPPEEEAYWAPVSASALRWSRWFAGNERPPRSTERPKIEIDAPGGTVTVTSPEGVAWLGFGSNGDIVTFQDFPDGKAPKKVELKLDDIRAKMGEHPLTRISALGGNGEGEGRDL